MSRILSFTNGDTFEIKWIFRYGFWRILLFGIAANFGYVIYTSPTKDKGISVGSDEPIPEFWDSGFCAGKAGVVFGQCIILYEKQFK